MLFTSITFLAFAVLFIPLYWGFCRSRWRNLILITGSFVFYGAGDWRRCGLLLFVGATNYAAGWILHRFPERKRVILPIFVCVNLLLLFSFKYVLWCLATLSAIPSLQDNHWLHLASNQCAALDYSLAIGLSFYCFQGLTYTIGVARGNIAYCRNILDVLAFQSLFPVILAGPICRAEHLLPQLRAPRAVTNAGAGAGFRLIALGMFKKMAIADSLVPFVDQIFDAPVVSASAWLWGVAVLAFTVQIYCDFSGYSDIAIGLGKLLGFDFDTNFNMPYVSTTLTEFWRRWHMSLSTWFRDYVYIPLGGNRRGKMRSVCNLWLTMVLSGVWHGAAWTYVAWGAYHGTILAVEKLLGLARMPPRKLPMRFLQWLLVFILVAFGWLIFRARSLAQVCDVVRVLTTPGAWALEAVLDNSLMPNTLLVITVFCMSGAAGMLWLRLRSRMTERVALSAEQLAAVLLVLIAIFFRGPGREFIYFQY
jgi:D-alanyl-lipoteichoic acid acyltransferase DltB (MBOAT superfamily)